MTLEMLLEEQSAVGSKISAALTKIGEWFEKTAESVKDKFAEIKAKVSRKLNERRELLEKAGMVEVKVPVDIEFDKYNAKTVKNIRGRMTPKEVFKELAAIFKEVLELFRKDCMSVIDLCKYAIDEVKRMKNRRNDREDIKEHYIKIDARRKEVMIRREEVTTGTEAINAMFTRLRAWKFEYRQDQIKGVKDDKESFKKASTVAKQLTKDTVFENSVKAEIKDGHAQLKKDMKKAKHSWD